jgi:type II secretory pathway pseudopilin PulG
MEAIARMRPLLAALKRQEGLSLIELLQVMLVMSLVVAAVLGLSRVASTEQRRVQSGVEGLAAQRNALERMTRELRKASTVCSTYPTCGAAFSSAASIDFETCKVSNSSGCTKVWIRYDCSGSPAQAVPPALTTRACFRTEATSGGGLGSGGSLVIGNVATSPTGVFTFENPDYVKVSVPVVTKGRQNPISMDHGVELRNAN